MRCWSVRLGKKNVMSAKIGWGPEKTDSLLQSINLDVWEFRYPAAKAGGWLDLDYGLKVWAKTPAAWFRVRGAHCSPGWQQSGESPEFLEGKSQVRAWDTDEKESDRLARVVLVACLSPSPPRGRFLSPRPSPRCWSIAVGMRFAAEGPGCCQPDAWAFSPSGSCSSFCLSCVLAKKKKKGAGGGRILSCWFSRGEDTGLRAGDEVQACLCCCGSPDHGMVQPGTAPYLLAMGFELQRCTDSLNKALSVVRLVVHPPKASFKVRFICVLMSLVALAFVII